VNDNTVEGRLTICSALAENLESSWALDTCRVVGVRIGSKASAKVFDGYALGWNPQGVARRCGMGTENSLFGLPEVYQIQRKMDGVGGFAAVSLKGAA
jgi:hypothetical protein